ncbi:probable aspartic proteinase GIP2 [Vicia villosa]|uniref:probable aspartic proteinase GIP2 n=1 Tax=Vicia villosa TaxID=3911 RepID=UPI00273B018B|nr:probable aspartic proteinase GIP2 [Vicia villosa]
MFILPIGKDPITNLFYTSIGIGTPQHNFLVRVCGQAVKHLGFESVLLSRSKTASVAPFGACFDLSNIGRTKTGLDVPTIDLVLEGGVEWTIYGGNSMILVNKNVACLGFVDAGKEPRTAVVIGGHILEDNLLEFDLVSSKLRFSSSLLLHNARCSNSEAI